MLHLISEKKSFAGGGAGGGRNMKQREFSNQRVVLV